MTTIAHLADLYLREREARGELATSSLANYRYTLNSLARVTGATPARALERDDIERWLETRGRFAASTRRSQFSLVRTFCRWMQQRGYVRHDPTRDLARPKPPRHVPRALTAALVGQLLRSGPDSRARAVVWLMVGLGLRCAEVAHLQLGDWDRSSEVMLISGKGGHERTLPVPPETARAVDTYLAEYPTGAGPLIRSYREPGCGLSPRTVSDLVSTWMLDAGVKHRSGDGVAAHSLRHTAASDVLEACGDLRVVQEMLGHQHLATTTIYLRRVPLGRLREAMAGRTYRV